MSADFNFNFRGTPDPLLGTTDYAAQFSELEGAQRALEQRRQALLQLKQQAEAPQVSPNPIWDEIDAITGAMSESDFASIQNDPEYQASLNELMAYVSAIQLQMIRPRIEQSVEGKKLLEQHLATVKYLRKNASAEKDKRMAEFKDYTEHYSHLSWEEYLKTKGGKKK